MRLDPLCVCTVWKHPGMAGGEAAKHRLKSHSSGIKNAPQASPCERYHRWPPFCVWRPRPRPAPHSACWPALWGLRRAPPSGPRRPPFLVHCHSSSLRARCQGGARPASLSYHSCRALRGRERLPAPRPRPMPWPRPGRPPRVVLLRTLAAAPGARSKGRLRVARAAAPRPLFGGAVGRACFGAPPAAAPFPHHWPTHTPATGFQAPL
ncbi:MAG: hypothetical protein J3K34DRAFT_431741 [Monoraphidium minutum]|nr:MAG: hypothetical protein J3K34DRAFT_431741 [Monoraphidium minutum]